MKGGTMRVILRGPKELVDGTIVGSFVVPPELDDDFHEIKKAARAGKRIELMVCEEPSPEPDPLHRVWERIRPVIEDFLSDQTCKVKEADNGSRARTFQYAEGSE
jgi:hypothetical protein